jgi:F0F1-type ATP synthase assembly protein I
MSENHALVGGEEWESAIYRAIQKADAFLVLISKHAADSSRFCTEPVCTSIDQALSMASLGKEIIIKRMERGSVMKTQLTRELLDVAISVAVVTGCSLVGLVIGTLMGASWQERNWSMLYGVAFIGSMAAFVSMIKLAQISRLLRDREVHRKE